MPAIAAAENPQQALGVFFTLAAFDIAEASTSSGEMFHRIFPSVSNNMYLLLTAEGGTDVIAAAAWYQCAPAYAALVMNKSRPITASEARSGVGLDNHARVIWHTMLAPYGDTEYFERLMKTEIVKITGMAADQPLYHTYNRVIRKYTLSPR